MRITSLPHSPTHDMGDSKPHSQSKPHDHSNPTNDHWPHKWPHDIANKRCRYEQMLKTPTEQSNQGTPHTYNKGKQGQSVKVTHHNDDAVKRTVTFNMHHRQRKQVHPQRVQCVTIEREIITCVCPTCPSCIIGDVYMYFASSVADWTRVDSVKQWQQWQFSAWIHIWIQWFASSNSRLLTSTFSFANMHTNMAGLH